MKYIPATRAIHGGRPPRGSGPVVQPIYQTAMFAAQNFEEQASLPATGQFYTRYDNPNFRTVERVLSDLEDTEAAVVFGSGMAAISTVCLSLLDAGDHVIAQRDLFSGTVEFFDHHLKRFGIPVTYLDTVDPEHLADALRTTTRMVYIESPSNPLLRLVDLERVAAFCRQHRLISIVDNTFASPINQRPAQFGIDVSVHSGTKYLSGHSDLICGAACGSRDIMARVRDGRRDFGGILDPHAVFLLQRGLKTLSLRVQRQNETAERLATYLQERPEIRTVHYPFLDTHPQQALARRQMAGGGGMVSFELEGGLDDTRRFAEALKVFTLAGSLGSVESLVTVPSLTTHSRLSPETRAAMGISDGLIRMSVGIEDALELEADLEQALRSLAGSLVA
jgi:cystathionine beta-lyase/cystathionine gamma-synthase